MRTKKTTGNQALLQTTHQSDKHLGCTHCKIHRIILKIGEIKTSANGPENMKTNDDA